MDWFWLAMKWLGVGVAVLPVAIGIGWDVVEGSILPRLVPRADIEDIAEAVLRDHPDDPEGWAFMEEDAAWRRSLSFEQGKWYRVRKAIRRRLLAGDFPPSA